MPAAHSPPMPRPNSARSANSIAYDGREPAEECKEREPQHRQHQRQLASPLVRSGPGERAADQPHDQRHRPERAGERAIDGEALLDVDDDEGEDVEVERVNDPAEEHRPEGAPLIARDLPVPGKGSGWVVDDPGDG